MSTRLWVMSLPPYTDFLAMNDCASSDSKYKFYLLKKEYLR